MRVDSLAGDLQRLLDGHTGPAITLGTVLESLGTRGFGVLLFLLSLPSALPVPAPGYSTPFGILIAGLGLQMLVGKPMPALPRWALDRQFKRETAEKMFGAGIRFLTRSERLIRPRMSWVGSRGGRALMSVLVIVMAALMILPIPLTNTFPAFVIFLIGIGLTERDGLIIVVSTIAGWISVAVYAAVIYAVYYLGTTTFDELKAMIAFWN
ncbi:MAG: hypothetical protein MAG453_00203 [Calditrichaeota bacterium]|nr:hypothetical protein [Calditrichota bacterium]